MINDQSIFGTGPDGAGETNDGGLPISLPVYKSIAANGVAVEVCSFNDAGTYNKLGVSQFLRLNVTSAGSVSFNMTRTSGAATTDPDFVIYKQGNEITRFNGSANNTESGTVTLTTGVHIITAYDSVTLDQTPGQDACFDMTIN